MRRMSFESNQVFVGKSDTFSKNVTEGKKFGEFWVERYYEFI